MYFESILKLILYIVLALVVLSPLSGRKAIFDTKTKEILVFLFYKFVNFFSPFEALENSFTAEPSTSQSNSNKKCNCDCKKCRKCKYKIKAK